MVILISGASHTGKTFLAQKLLEDYKYPYLSIDHLKMGLIRSGETNISVEDDDKLTDYLWPIVREIVKTVIENDQNLIIEGIYIPFNWAEDFEENYLAEIKYVCLVMSHDYIAKHFENIKTYSNIIEKRLNDSYCTLETVLKDNKKMLEGCIKNDLNYILIDNEYSVDFERE